MNERQQRLVNYVRELSERDRLQPASFPTRAQTGIDKLLKATPVAAFAGTQLEGMKRSELFARGLDKHISIAPPLETQPAPAQPTLTPEAAEAYDKVLKRRKLTDADYVHIESLVLPALRPAFDIVNESYATLPAAWDPFNQKRAAMEPLIRGVGQLQLTGHPAYTMVGTGFVCGPRAIVTNHHVAQIFVQGIDSGMALNFMPGVTCGLEMLAEVGSTTSLRIAVSRPLVISTCWDAAVLQVEELPAGVIPLPLAGQPPASLDGGFAAIVGYPSYDPSESLVDQVNLFRTVFDRKRLQPGKLNGFQDIGSFGHTVHALAHDCSTLGGNSGSALIAADEVKVVGLHFGGITHQSNFAVPTWELAKDPALHAVELSIA